MSSEDRSTCRDFERGVCNRGDKCRYAHPQGIEQADNHKLPICKDFQNKGCTRMKCKFLHVTVAEEAEYMKSGTLPSHGGRPELNISLLQRPTPSNEMCKDFLKNMCERGSRCKFSHSIDRGGGGGDVMYEDMNRIREDCYSVSNAEENEMLKRKIADLQREIMELRQMNDSLYDENTRYRAQIHMVATVAGNPTLAAMHTNANNIVTNAAVPRYLMPTYYSDMKY